MDGDWAAIVPQAFLMAGGLLIFCAGAFWAKRPPWFLFALAVAATAGCGLSVLTVKPGSPDFCGMVDAGGQAGFFALVLSLITLLTLFFSKAYAKARGFSGDEFYGLVLFAALGMLLLSSALHWVIFFLGLELFSISLYVLIGIQRSEASSAEAALKYLILGAVASGFLTFGIAMVYAATGRMNIAQSLGGQVQNLSGGVLILGLGLILVGVGFKLSLVPFHLWTPDVYQGAPLPVTAFLSTGSKVATLAALLRISLSASELLWVNILPILWILAALTMVVGNVTALTQNHLKRLLAYSSVAQMGYLLMALVAVKPTGTSAVAFYAAVYALMDLGAFGALTLLSQKDADLDAIADCRGLGYGYPWQAAMLAVCLFSLAGLPPTAGFIGKFLLFRATIQAGFVGLALIGILSAIVSIYYYLKVIVSLYMRPAEVATIPIEIGFPAHLATATIFCLILWLGIMPSPLLDCIGQMLSAIAV
jgi:NADH-quinone oxidoreductase subunit N